MGGKDVVCVKQLKGSTLTQSDVQARLKKLADDKFSQDSTAGGDDNGQGHSKWLSTITSSPDVISMAFVPITTLLTGVRGCGFLDHAVNLYLRCKRFC